MDTLFPKKPDLSGRTALRTAAVFAILVSAVNVLIFSAAWLISREFLHENLKTHVEEMRRTLEDVYAMGGGEALVKVVVRRIAAGDHDEDVFEDDEDILLVTDKAHRFLGGNIKGLPYFADWRLVPWQQLTFADNERAVRSTDAVLGRWTTFPDVQFFIGDGNGRIRNLESLLTQAFVGGILASLFCASIVGLWLGARAQRRLTSIDRVLRSVAEGELGRRIPISRKSDDIDDIAKGVNSTLERMEALFNELKQVASDIAHDLRSPITRLRYKLELMSEHGDAKQADLQDAIVDVDEIASIFDSILRISDIESRKRAGQLAQLDLVDVAENAVEAMTAVAENRGHRCSLKEPATRPVAIMGDRRLLTQLMVNLIENSIMHCEKHCEILIYFTLHRDSVTMVVADDGPGIPKEEKERVFRRLYRMDKSRSTPGHGLGLSLVKSIAEMHGATVVLADNDPGLSVEINFALSSPRAVLTRKSG